MNITKRINEETLWLVFLCLAAFFINNSALPVDIMETRNLVMAREMVSDGNWLAPTLNGVMHLEKPPLPTWIAALVEMINPRDLSSQRSAAGLVAVMMTAFVYLTGFYTTHRRDFARTATIVFITCYNVILMGRSVTWDIYCHAFMMGGIYYLMRLLYDDRYYPVPHKWRHAFRAGIFMGLSMLSKGPVAFYALLLPFVVAMLVMVRPTMRNRWAPLTLMIVTTLVVGGWWFVAMWWIHPEAFGEMVHGETSAWLHHNVRPWWYYWRFFSEMGAWGLLLLVALAVPYWRKRVPQPRNYLRMTICLVVMLVLLSIMPEKKMRYLLPMTVPVAMLVTHILLYFKDRHVWPRFAHSVFVVNGVLLILLMLAMPVLVHFYMYKREIVDHGTSVVIDVVCIVIAGYIYRNIRLRHVVNIVNAVAVIFVIAECFMIGSIGKSFSNPNLHSIKYVARRDSIKPYAFYHNANEDVRTEIIYQAGKKIIPLNFSNAQAVLKATPCVVVSREPLSKEIPANVLRLLDTVKVDVCDDNTHPQTDKHYTRAFINQISILRAKAK